MKKSPLKSPKNFLTAVAGMSGVCAQSGATAEPPRRTAGRRAAEKYAVCQNPHKFAIGAYDINEEGGSPGGARPDPSTFIYHIRRTRYEQLFRQPARRQLLLDHRYRADRSVLLLRQLTHRHPPKNATGFPVAFLCCFRTLPRGPHADYFSFLAPSLSRILPQVYASSQVNPVAPFSSALR